MLGESMMLQLVWKALKQQVLNEAGADAMQNKKPTLHGLIYTTVKKKKKTKKTGHRAVTLVSFPSLP